MQAALSIPVNVNALCIHEAGHVIYLTRAGLGEFSYFKSRITYDAERGKFDGYLAEVLPRVGRTFPTNLNLNLLNDWLFQVAQGFAAGGVFARELTNATLDMGDVGDSADYERFSEMCYLIHQGDPSNTIDRETTWKQAQEAVKKDLRNSKSREEAWKKAKEIKQTLFGI